MLGPFIHWQTDADVDPVWANLGGAPPVPDTVLGEDDISSPYLITGDMNLLTLRAAWAGDGHLVAAIIRDPTSSSMLHVGFGLGPFNTKI